MTDSKTKDTSKKAKPIVNKQQLTSPSAKSTGSGKWFSVFAITLSLVALLGSAVTWYQNTILKVQQESKLALGVTEIGGKISRLGDSLSRIQEEQVNVVSQSDLSFRVLALKTELKNEIKDLLTTQARLTESVESINAELNKGYRRYVLDEVSQLLRLANNRLIFGGMADVDSAISALTLADQQLKSLNDSRFVAVRSELRQEITQLKQVNSLNIEEVSLVLHSMSLSIPSMLLANEPEETKLTVNITNTAPEVTWRTELKKVWQDMLSAVTIQRVDQPPKPLLVPQQRYFLNHNLQITLSKAELALLQGENELFKQSINEASNWLEEYFDVTDPKVSLAIQQLKDINAKAVNVKLPSLSGSSNALYDIIGG